MCGLVMEGFTKTVETQLTAGEPHDDPGRQLAVAATGLSC